MLFFMQQTLINEGIDSIIFNDHSYGILKKYHRICRGIFPLQKMAMNHKFSN